MKLTDKEAALRSVALLFWQATQPQHCLFNWNRWKAKTWRQSSGNTENMLGPHLRSAGLNVDHEATQQCLEWYICLLWLAGGNSGWRGEGGDEGQQLEDEGITRRSTEGRGRERKHKREAGEGGCAGGVRAAGWVISLCESDITSLFIQKGGRKRERKRVLHCGKLYDHVYRCMQ